LLAKDLFFSVFNITNTENKVKAKYKTKNNMTDDVSVFLARRNQMSAKLISRRNLTLTDPRLCNVCASGSFFWPIEKIRTVIVEMSAKTNESIARSVRRICTVPVTIRAYPKIIIKIRKSSRMI